MFNASIICFLVAGFFMICAVINQILVMKKLTKPNVEVDKFFNKFIFTAIFGILSTISFICGVVTFIAYLVK